MNIRDSKSYSFKIINQMKNANKNPSSTYVNNSVEIMDMGLTEETGNPTTTIKSVSEYKTAGDEHVIKPPDYLIPILDRLKNKGNILGDIGDRFPVILKFSDRFTTVFDGLIEGFLADGEGVVDAHFYGTALILKGISAGYIDDEWAENIISYDVSGKFGPQNAVLTDEELKKSNWASMSKKVGEGLGYGILSLIPYCGVAVSAFAGAGREAEESMNLQLKETGTINDWTVFFESLCGSGEGFLAAKSTYRMSDAFKNVGKFPGIKASVEEMFKDGPKAGIKEFGKSVIPTIESAAGNFIKDPAAWIEANANMTDDFFLDDERSIQYKSFWPNMAEAGLGYLAEFIK